MRTSATSILLLMFASQSNAQLAKDSSGWSVIPNISNTKYSSSNSGKDTNLGSLSAPYKTIGKGFSSLPDGTAQGIALIKNNETFKGESVFLKSDGLATAPNVLAPYGSGVCPMLIDTRIFSHTGNQNSDGVQNTAIIGLCFNHSLKDPASSTHNLVNQTGIESGLELIVPGNNVLFEGLNLKYSNFVLQSGLKNITVRRSVITDNYSLTSHAQGMYASSLDGITLEENIFDHNGWLKQQYMGNDNKAEGQATIYNHNTYFTNNSNVIMRRNVFMRPSSIQNKFTANPSGTYDEIKSSNITIDNNLYYDGEVMLSIGGNVDRNTGARFKNVKVLNNVFTEVGTSRPTNRTIAWGIDASDWAGGEIKNNILTNFVPGNGYFLNVTGHTSTLPIGGNKFYHPSTASLSGGAVVKFTGGKLSAVTFSGNHIQAPSSSQVLISISAEAVGKVKFSGNTYYSLHAKPFQIGGVNYTFAEWKSRTGDTSEFKKIVYPDATRSFVKYASSKGLSLSGVFTHIRQLRKGNWPGTISAKSINDYIRSGFGVAAVP